MANFLRSLSGGRPFHGDDHLEAMLSGQPLPENADAELHGVNELLVALRAALDAYRETFATSDPAHQRRRRPAMLSTLLGAKLGAALAAGAVGFGGIAVAAAAGVLPDAAQDFAHNAVRVVPAANHGQSAEHVKTAETTAATPVGPDATGPAAFGLCTAWSHAKDSGNAAEKSIAFHNLATAATAAGAHSVTAAGIDTYCVRILAAKGTDTPGKSATHPTGKPSPLPGAGTTGKSGVTPGTPPSRH
jgi:hypothetical protein